MKDFNLYGFQMNKLFLIIGVLVLLVGCNRDMEMKKRTDPSDIKVVVGVPYSDDPEIVSVLKTYAESDLGWSSSEILISKIGEEDELVVFSLQVGESDQSIGDEESAVVVYYDPTSKKVEKRLLYQ